MTTAYGRLLFRGAVASIISMCLCCSLQPKPLASSTSPLASSSTAIPPHEGTNATGAPRLPPTVAASSSQESTAVVAIENAPCEQIKAQLDQLTPEQRSRALAKMCGIFEEKKGPTEDDLRRERASGLEQLNRRFRPVLAKRTTYRAKAKPVLVVHLYLGDGWGCAQLHDDSTYCWQASPPGTQVATIKAEHVPWLDDRSLGAGPDRICTREVGYDYRCWRAPEFMSLDRTWRKPDPKSVNPNMTWVVSTHGGDSLVDGQPVSHGAWHGCSSSWCWNPAAPQSVVKLCRVGGTVIPCAGVDEATLREFDDRPNLGSSIVGDLFACRRWNDKLECLGASRDGFFGTAEECPKELFTSWPTKSGPVAAPNAKCANKPVRVGSSRFFGDEASASSRGICIGDQDVNTHNEDGSLKVKYHCFGAVTPFQPGLSSIQLGLGDEPSACALNTAGEVLCWGHGYTNSSARSVSIEFAIPKSDPIVAWQGKGRFHTSCQNHRNCTKSAPPLPACREGLKPLRLSDVFKRAEELKDTSLALSGTLGMSDVVSDQDAIQCGPYEADGITPDVKRGGGFGDDYCCIEAHGPVVVADSNGYLPLEGILCSGDRSQMCCNIPVLGQRVVVTGTLVWRDYVAMLGPSWALADPEICQLNP
ncbi:MAG: hypothetical protein QM784_39090 [Polyangiaceae bacterium]